MRPSAKSIIHGNPWSSKARNRFVTLLKGHSLIVSLYSILHGVIRVQLLINTETTKTNVADIMVEEEHAEKAEESFDSKVTFWELRLFRVKCIGQCVIWKEINHYRSYLIPYT